MTTNKAYWLNKMGKDNPYTTRYSSIGYWGNYNNFSLGEAAVHDTIGLDQTTKDNYFQQNVFFCPKT